MSGENFSQIRAEDLILGRLVIQKRLASKDQVTSLLRHQKEQSTRGKLVRLSQLLLSQGKISQQQIRELEAIKQKNFMICQGCYTQFNVEAFDNGKRFKCKSCARILTVDRQQAPAVATVDVTPPPPVSPPAPKSLTFEGVQQYLCIDAKELGLVVSSGELKGFLDGNIMKFNQDDVDRVKKSKEVQPTLILDQPAESEDMGDAFDIEEEIPMSKVLSLLQIDETQLRKLMTVGELVPNYKDDGQAWFPKEVVQRIKQSREAQPTMILTDKNLDQSLAGEHLIVFEEAMEDLGIDAPTLRDLLSQAEIHPIARGENQFFKTSDIAKIRSQMRMGKQKDTQGYKLSSQPTRAEKLLTFEEVLEILKIQPRVLRQMVVSKQLKGVSSDGVMKFHLKDVENLKGTTGEEKGGGQLVKVPLLKQIPSGSASTWQGLANFQDQVEDYLSIPNLPSPVFAFVNPDGTLFPPSDILFLVPPSPTENYNFQNFFLMRMATGERKIRKLGIGGDSWVFMGKEDQPPEIVPKSQAEIQGKICGRFSSLL